MNILKIESDNSKKICGYCKKEIKGQNYLYSLIKGFYKHGKYTKCYKRNRTY